MQILRNTTRPAVGKDLFSQIESTPILAQNGWDYIADNDLINKANQSINIIDYLSNKIILDETNSSTAWTYKAKCPFHKGGDERTASLYINQEQGRFYCQACGKSGGVVEYIAFIYKRPLVVVAEHILKCISGDFTIEATAAKKAAERRKYQNYMIILSKLYNKFVKEHLDDIQAVEYANKCYYGFDLILETKPEGVQSSIEEISKRFDLYLKKYDLHGEAK